MFFIILCFILSLKVVFIHAERHTWRQNRWAIAPIWQGKLNMFNLPCKTVQDYPARLHASYCATLQRVGYLARCCTQYIARYLARNIASCRQAFKVVKKTCRSRFDKVVASLISDEYLIEKTEINLN